MGANEPGEELTSRDAVELENEQRLVKSIARPLILAREF